MKIVLSSVVVVLVVWGGRCGPERTSPDADARLGDPRGRRADHYALVHCFGVRQTTTQLTPMNRLGDAARPESRTARIFNEIAGRIASGQATSEDIVTARQWLTTWSGNHPRLEPMLQNGLLNDVAPVSQNLARVATVGLQALDYLDRRNAPASRASQQEAFLKEATKPQADLLLAVVPGVQKLVAAVK